jgi:hypothetical protein
MWDSSVTKLPRCELDTRSLTFSNTRRFLKIMVFFYSEDGSSRFLRNFDLHLKPTRRHIPEDSNLKKPTHHHDNLNLYLSSRPTCLRGSPSIGVKQLSTRVHLVQKLIMLKGGALPQPPHLSSPHSVYAHALHLSPPIS